MWNNSTLQVLIDIRVDLLRYWNQEQNQTLKEELSQHLDNLDNLISEKRREVERLNKLLGDI